MSTAYPSIQRWRDVRRGYAVGSELLLALVVHKGRVAFSTVNMEKKLQVTLYRTSILTYGIIVRYQWCAAVEEEEEGLHLPAFRAGSVRRRVERW